MNPLVIEAWRGLGVYSKLHKTWLGYLLLQAGVLLLWWPDADITERLETHDVPEPLLAVLIAAGVSLCYLSLRLGAEEILLDGQFSLREWVLTEVGLDRLLFGFVGAQVIGATYMLLTSAPLLLAGYHVGGGTLPVVGALLGLTLLLALAYRLLGATIYFAIGHLGAETFVLLRLAFVLAYLPVAVVVAPLSHFMLCYHAMNGVALSPDLGFSPIAVFGVFYGVGCAVLLVVLYRQMLSYRRRAVAEG